MFEVEVSQDCIGCGACAGVCSMFEIVDGKSRHKKGKMDKITCEKEAAELCPVQAIKIKKE